MAFTLTPERTIEFGTDVLYNEPFMLDGGGDGDFSQTRKKHIPCRRELLVTSLQKFYSGIENLDTLIEVMQGNGPYSLRLIDVFVTNYAKKYNTAYMLGGNEFVVYLNYKSQTKAYSKKLFDPFCRRERILFQAGNQQPFVTTVGQLNFFRWAHEKGILKYIGEHIEEIRREEKETRRQNTGSQNSTLSDSSTISNTSSASISTQSTLSTGSTRRRRTEKVPASIKLLHKHDVEITICFD